MKSFSKMRMAVRLVVAMISGGLAMDADHRSGDSPKPRFLAPDVAAAAHMMPTVLKAYQEELARNALNMTLPRTSLPASMAETESEQLEDFDEDVLQAIRQRQIPVNLCNSNAYQGDGIIASQNWETLEKCQSHCAEAEGCAYVAFASDGWCIQFGTCNSPLVGGSYSNFDTWEEQGEGFVRATTRAPEGMSEHQIEKLWSGEALREDKAAKQIQRSFLNSRRARQEEKEEKDEKEETEEKEPKGDANIQEEDNLTVDDFNVGDKVITKGSPCIYPEGKEGIVYQKTRLGFVIDPPEGEVRVQFPGTQSNSKLNFKASCLAKLPV